MIVEKVENAGPTNEFHWFQGSWTFEAKKKQRPSSLKLLHVVWLKPNWVVEHVLFYVSGQYPARARFATPANEIVHF